MPTHPEIEVSVQLRDSLRFLLYKSYIITHEAIASLLKEAGIAERDFFVLLALDSRSFSQSNLAALLEINDNAMVKLIDKLEHKGFVARKQNVRNRRAYLIETTKYGNEFRDKMMIRISALQKHQSPLTLEEMERLKDLLRKLLGLH